MALLSPPMLRRFHRFAASLHPSVEREMRRHLSFLAAPLYRGTRSSGRQLPVWMLLPRWLALDWRSELEFPRVRRGFLPDILWAQFCLFAFVKLHDDVFDGHVRTPGLIFAGDAFLLEARRSIARHFDETSPLWRFHDSAVRTTLRTITAVDEAQQRAEARYPTIARLYTEGYAMCKVATYAVCLAAGKAATFRRCSEYLDGFAIAGQVLDDLEDMESDLARGRVNFAAATFARRAQPRGFKMEEAAKQLVRGIVLTDASDRLFGRLSDEIERGIHFITPLAVAPALRFALRFRRSLDQLADGYRRKRVDLLFGGLMRG